MSEVTVTTFSSTKWNGVVWEIRDKESNLTATVTERGGRLISLQFDGQELVYSKAELFSKIPDVLRRERKDVGWDQILLGGEKTWIAPQSKFGGKVPFLVPDVGSYTVQQLPDGLKLTSQVCPETGLQVVREIRMGIAGPGTFQINASIINRGGEEQRVAPWSVFQLLAPAYVRVGPLVSDPEAFQDAGVGHIPVERVIESTDPAYAFFVLGRGGESFKAGFSFAEGGNGMMETTFGAGIGKGSIHLTQSFSVPAGPYPHKGRGELYYGGEYFETEVLNPLETLRPGQTSQSLQVNFAVSKE
jgi:hypothetical protein